MKKLLYFVLFYLLSIANLQAQDTLNSKSIVFAYSQTYIGKDIRLGITKYTRKNNYLTFGAKFYINDVYLSKGNYIDLGGYGQKQFRALYPEHRGGLFFNVGKECYKTKAFTLYLELKNQLSYLKTNYAGIWAPEGQRNTVVMENNFGLNWVIPISPKLSIIEYVGTGLTVAHALKREPYFNYGFTERKFLLRLNYHLSAAIEYKF